MNIAEMSRLIITMRQHHGFTQQQFSEKINVNQSTISRIENGDENISLDLYLTCIKYFGLHVIDDQPKVKEAVYTILDAGLNNDSERVKASFKNIEDLNEYSIQDYFYLHIAKIFLYAHVDRYKELVEIAEFLQKFTFVYDEELQLFNHIAQAYALSHNQKIQEAFGERQKAFELMIQLQIQLPILYLTYGLDNIMVRRYNTAAISFYNGYKTLPHDLEHWGFYNIIKNMGTLQLFEGDYKEALANLTQTYNLHKMRDITFYFRQQLDSFIGLAHLKLEQYEQALAYFKDGIEVGTIDSITETCYYYSFFICRELKLKEEYDGLWKQFMESKHFENELMQKIIAYFFAFDGVDLEAFIKDFNTIYQQVFKNPMTNVFTRALFTFYGEAIWKMRQYRSFKQFYDVILQTKFVHLTKEL
jgi:DNA-binding XRE family transcriptional regulator